MNEDKIHELRRNLVHYSKEEIIEICLKEISEKGYVFLKEKFPNTSEDALDMAVPDLVNSGKLMVDPTPFQKKWVIRKNHNYKSKHYDFKIQLFTALLTLIIGILLWLIDNQSKLQEIQGLKNRLEKIEKKIQ